LKTRKKRRAITIISLEDHELQADGGGKLFKECLLLANAKLLQRKGAKQENL